LGKKIGVGFESQNSRTVLTTSPVEVVVVAGRLAGLTASGFDSTRAPLAGTRAACAGTTAGLLATGTGRRFSGRGCVLAAQGGGLFSDEQPMIATPAEMTSAARISQCRETWRINRTRPP
jgi:hypothetical protein